MAKKCTLLLTILTLTILTPCFVSAQRVFNVIDFGATGDGTTLDTRAINKAIEAASRAGGGTIFVPAGNYNCGSIHLKSNITIYLDQGAVLVATSQDPGHNYDSAEVSVNTTYQDYGHSHWHNSFIWGDSLQHVAITGPGKIYGQGLVRDHQDSDSHANKAISLYRCRDVLLRDLTIQHGGWFGILATGVDELTIDNLKIDTNRDGIDIDACQNVHVSNTTVNSPWDDAICLKSSFGLGMARPTENVTITNCQVSGYDEGTLLDGTYRRTPRPAGHGGPIGRIKFGTESNGGFRNIAISNCVFDYCYGLALETVDGGLLENVTINNIIMRDPQSDPIFLRLGARMRGPAGTPIGQLHHVMISHVVVYNAVSPNSCTIAGLPGHPIDDVHLSDIHIYYQGGGTSQMASAKVPENEDHYPEPGMFGPSPAYGLFIRHASNIDLHDIEFSYLQPDQRPALYLDDVQHVYAHDLQLQKEEGVAPVHIAHTSDFKISQSPGIQNAAVDQADSMDLR